MVEDFKARKAKFKAHLHENKYELAWYLFCWLLFAVVLIWIAELGVRNFGVLVICYFIMFLLNLLYEKLWGFKFEVEGRYSYIVRMILASFLLSSYLLFVPNKSTFSILVTAFGASLLLHNFNLSVITKMSNKFGGGNNHG